MFHFFPIQDPWCVARSSQMNIFYISSPVYAPSETIVLESGDMRMREKMREKRA